MVRLNLELLIMRFYKEKPKEQVVMEQLISLHRKHYKEPCRQELITMVSG
jgi:hypothetical protein